MTEYDDQLEIKALKAELTRLRESRSALEASNVDLIIELNRLRVECGKAVQDWLRAEKDLTAAEVGNTRLREALRLVRDNGCGMHCACGPIADNALKEDA